jgi:hypothetical protein
MTDAALAADAARSFLSVDAVSASDTEFAERVESWMDAARHSATMLSSMVGEQRAEELLSEQLTQVLVEHAIRRMARRAEKSNG